MLAFNFIPCAEFGSTRTIPSRKYWFFFKTKEEKIFTPSREYIMVDNNKTCPTVIAHPSMMSHLIDMFIALPSTDRIKADVVCENGVPVSYRILKD